MKIPAITLLFDISLNKFIGILVIFNDHVVLLEAKQGFISLVTYSAKSRKSFDRELPLDRIEVFFDKNKKVKLQPTAKTFDHATF